jgi:hypothetical protein
MFGLGMNYSLWYKNDAPQPFSSNIVKQIGGYKDAPSRALPYYLGSCNTKTDVNSAAKICSQRARDNGYKYFGLQCPQCNTQCFAGNDLSRATKYGSVNTSGLGGGWQNYIYENLNASEYVDTSGYCSGNPNQRIYIGAGSNQYATAYKNEEQCKNWCSGDGRC